MPALFTKLLAERLDNASAVSVVEAVEGMRVEPGRIHIAPGDFHMIPVRQGTDVVLRLNQEPPENSCRPAADPLFRAAARIWGANTLAVVLTGMGADGCQGSGEVVAAGGQCFAQDEATSVVWGMPGFVTRAGHADKNVPLPEVAAEIVRRCSVGRALTTTNAPRGATAGA
jgi:two-component system chemotaxis response regulator CheB